MYKTDAERRARIEEIKQQTIRHQIEGVAAANRGNTETAALHLGNVEKLSAERRELAGDILRDDAPAAPISADERRVEALNLPGNWERLAATIRERFRNDPTSDPAYYQAYLSYIRTRGDSVPSILAEGSREHQAMFGGSDIDGGYVLPLDRRIKMIGRLPAVSEILNLVTVVPAFGNEVEWPRVQPHASSPDIYTSAFVGSMVSEVPAATDGDAEPEFGEFKIPLKKARAKAKPSMHLWDDAGGEFQEWLLNDGAINLGLVMSQQVLNGDGVGKNVLGVLNNSEIDATTNISGTTADHISNTTADAGSAPKLFDLLYAVPSQYRRSDSFRLVFSSNSEKRIRTLVDTNGNYMWSNNGGFGPRSNGFDGYSVAVDDFMPSGGTDANKVMLAGDMSQIFLALRGVITFQILRERYADTDQIGVILRTRFGVGVANPRALKIGIV